MDTVTLLEITNPAAFTRAHLPGAAYVAAPPNGADLTAATATATGPIVLYQNAGWPIPVARAFVALDALGLGGRVSILSGGLPAWIAADGLIERGAPPIRPDSQPPRPDPHPEVFVDRAYVAAHAGQPGYLTLDNRLPAYYSGAKAEPGEPAGHIPGAHSLAFTALATSGGHWLPPATLADAFRAGGYQPGDTVILYCHSGRKAAIAYVAARLLGYQARIYAGSWIDWTSHHGAVAIGPAEKGKMGTVP